MTRRADACCSRTVLHQRKQCSTEPSEWRSTWRGCVLRPWVRFNFEVCEIVVRTLTQELSVYVMRACFSFLLSAFSLIVPEIAQVRSERTSAWTRVWLAPWLHPRFSVVGSCTDSSSEEPKDPRFRIRSKLLFMTMWGTNLISAGGYFLSERN